MSENPGVALCQVAYTAKGRAWNSFDGRLATTQNAVFLAMRYGMYVLPSSGRKAAKYLCWARAQVPAAGIRIRKSCQSVASSKYFIVQAAKKSQG